MGGERVRGYEHEGVGQGQIVMPFYVILDVSYSMINDMAALNDSLQRLRRAIIAEPLVDDVAHICVMTFSDAAKVVMPLGQLSEHALPALDVEGGTDYGAAFRELAHVIPADAAALRARGDKIFRPCAFFLTDGEPNDSDWWETFKNTLTYNRTTGAGMKEHPVFIPFGFRNASEDVLRKLAYPPEKGKWFHVRNFDIEEALKLILDVIQNTVVSSGQSSSTGRPTLVHAPVPAMPGVTQGAAEDWI